MVDLVVSLVSSSVVRNKLMVFWALNITVHASASFLIGTNSGGVYASTDEL